MNIEVFDSRNHEKFIEKFGPQLLRADIYFHPGFLACEAELQNGEFEIFTVSTGDKVWMYPYLLLPIPNSEWLDISSPYGYAGPFTTDKNLSLEAEKHFLEYATNKNIVTEFVRYHPILQNEEELVFQENIVNLHNRTIVVADVTQNIEDLWKNSFSSTNRNVVRKLIKDGFEFGIKPFEIKDINDFVELYAATMHNAGATDFYFFDRSYYQELINKLPQSVWISQVTRNKEVYATALFFEHGELLTYYLSARNLEYPKVPASNLLLAKTCEWAHERGLKKVNFGGGLTNDWDNPLFKFKRNFSPITKKFFIGKRIHNQEQYKKIIQDFINQNGQEKYDQVKSILQFYRL
ncbi:MAG: GNAT family N-acetyltransferase [Bacteroidetes bacterium]|nr:GNAT family N-acetyltransferase [Bacteroidota bacterium]